MYDHIIFDTNNLAYTVFYSPNLKEENGKDIVKLYEKRIYKNFAKNLLDTVKMIESKFLAPDGEMTFLFDNHHSREEIKQLLKPLKMNENRRKINPVYKSKRKPEKLEFYNTIDMVRYFYTIGEKKYHTARITNLEADDLVKPTLLVVREKAPESKVLMVTNDSDWCRYLDDKTHYLPNLFEEPRGVSDFIEKFGFPPNEEKVVLYKILFGDDADNVDPVFPEFKKALREQILQTYDTTEDFLVMAPSHPDFKEYSDIISKHLVQVKIAYQVISSIPVSVAHLKAIHTNGRESKTLREAIMGAIIGTEEKKVAGFKFGGTKIPRQTPKE